MNNINNKTMLIVIMIIIIVITITTITTIIILIRTLTCQLQAMNDINKRIVPLYDVIQQL